MSQLLLNSIMKNQGKTQKLIKLPANIQIVSL